MGSVTAVIALVSAAVAAAPAVEAEVKNIYANGKTIVDALFSKDLIDVATQAAYHKWSDDHMNATLTGIEPPEFVVS